MIRPIGHAELQSINLTKTTRYEVDQLSKDKINELLQGDSYKLLNSDKENVAYFGSIKVDKLNAYVIWLIKTDLAEKNKMLLVKTIKAKIKELLCSGSSIFTLCENRDERSERWLSFLGLTKTKAVNEKYNLWGINGN